MTETMPTADSKNFVRQMPRPEVDPAVKQKNKQGADQAFRAWQAKVVANSQQEAAALTELNRKISAGDYQPDPKNFVRQLPKLTAEDVARADRLGEVPANRKKSGMFHAIVNKLFGQN